MMLHLSKMEEEELSDNHNHSSVRIDEDVPEANFSATFTKQQSLLDNVSENQECTNCTYLIENAEQAWSMMTSYVHKLSQLQILKKENQQLNRINAEQQTYLANQREKVRDMETELSQWQLKMGDLEDRLRSTNGQYKLVLGKVNETQDAANNWRKKYDMSQQLLLDLEKKSKENYKLHISSMAVAATFSKNQELAEAKIVELEAKLAKLQKLNEELVSKPESSSIKKLFNETEPIAQNSTTNLSKPIQKSQSPAQGNSAFKSPKLSTIDKVFNEMKPSTSNDGLSISHSSTSFLLPESTTKNVKLPKIERKKSVLLKSLKASPANITVIDLQEEISDLLCKADKIETSLNNLEPNTVVKPTISEIFNMSFFREMELPMIEECGKFNYAIKNEKSPTIDLRPINASLFQDNFLHIDSLQPNNVAVERLPETLTVKETLVSKITITPEKTPMSKITSVSKETPVPKEKLVSKITSVSKETPVPKEKLVSKITSVSKETPVPKEKLVSKITSARKRTPVSKETFVTTKFNAKSILSTSSTFDEMPIAKKIKVDPKIDINELVIPRTLRKTSARLTRSEANTNSILTLNRPNNEALISLLTSHFRLSMSKNARLNTEGVRASLFKEHKNLSCLVEVDKVADVMCRTALEVNVGDLWMTLKAQTKTSVRLKEQAFNEKMVLSNIEKNFFQFANQLLSEPGWENLFDQFSKKFAFEVLKSINQPETSIQHICRNFRLLTVANVFSRNASQTTLTSSHVEGESAVDKSKTDMLLNLLTLLLNNHSPKMFVPVICYLMTIDGELIFNNFFECTDFSRQVTMKNKLLRLHFTDSTEYVGVLAGLSKNRFTPQHADRFSSFLVAPASTDLFDWIMEKIEEIKVLHDSINIEGKNKFSMAKVVLEKIRDCIILFTPKFKIDIDRSRIVAFCLKQLYLSLVMSIGESTDNKKNEKCTKKIDANTISAEDLIRKEAECRLSKLTVAEAMSTANVAVLSSRLITPYLANIKVVDRACHIEAISLEIDKIAKCMEAIKAVLHKNTLSNCVPSNLLCFGVEQLLNSFNLFRTL